MKKWLFWLVIILVVSWEAMALQVIYDFSETVQYGAVIIVSGYFFYLLDLNRHVDKSKISRRFKRKLNL